MIVQAFSFNTEDIQQEINKKNTYNEIIYLVMNETTKRALWDGVYLINCDKGYSYKIKGDIFLNTNSTRIVIDDRLPTGVVDIR